VSTRAFADTRKQRMRASGGAHANFTKTAAAT
jgi:hypothetical protein